MENLELCRSIDELRRIPIPIEIRKSIGIEEKDLMKIEVEKDRIILKKKGAKCILCDSIENLQKFKEKNICKKCKEELKKQSN